MRWAFKMLLTMSFVFIGCSRNAEEKAEGEEIGAVKEAIVLEGTLFYVDGDLPPVRVEIPSQELDQDIANDFLLRLEALPANEFKTEGSDGDLRLSTLTGLEFSRNAKVVLVSTGGTVFVRRSSIWYDLDDSSVYELVLRWCKEGSIRNEKKSLPPMVE